MRMGNEYAVERTMGRTESGKCQSKTHKTYRDTLTLWIVAVSYTHLDVYKRQLLLNTMILGLKGMADDENYEEYIDLTFEEV